jgi:hypothetical protein
VTITPDSATVEYHMSTAVQYPSGGSTEHGELSSNFFKVDEIDTLKQTDSKIYGELTEDANLTAEIKEYDTSTTPFELNESTGLEGYEKAVGKYLEINLSENLQKQNGVATSKAYIQFYYTESELDRTGDGDSNDIEDIDESKLSLYYYDESAGQWTKLSAEMDWVFDIGVETADVEVYGNSYAGYVWAELEHFSIYSLSGLTYNRPPDVSNAYPSKECLWPCNHKFTDVTVEGVTDPDGDEVEITITGITSDEPASIPDSKSHSPDALGVGTATASLRAERLGKGNGRVYEISFVASDGKVGEAEGMVKVYVPHSKKANTCTCIDDGQKYDATSN